MALQKPHSLQTRLYFCSSPLFLKATMGRMLAAALVLLAVLSGAAAPAQATPTPPGEFCRVAARYFSEEFATPLLTAAAAGLRLVTGNQIGAVMSTFRARQQALFPAGQVRSAKPGHLACTQHSGHPGWPRLAGSGCGCGSSGSSGSSGGGADGRAASGASQQRAAVHARPAPAAQPGPVWHHSHPAAHSALH